MPLYKVRIAAVDIEAGRSASGRLGELTDPQALAVTLFAAEPPLFVVEAYYQDAADPAAIDRAIDRALADLGQRIGRAETDIVPDADWVAISQAALPPIQAGRFLVHGSHDRARVGLRPSAIEIEAGEAFGTGHNATTSGCLEAIDRLTRRRRFARALDLGCGTGVLAIAIARALPHSRVIASDDDPIATAIAQANVRLNRVASRIRVLTASGMAHPRLCPARAFDLVVANILPRPLIALAPALRRGLRPAGVAVLSGLLNHQAAQVVAAYRAHGLRVLTTHRHAGWTVLTLQKA